MAVAHLSWLILIFKGAKMENHSALRNRKMTADMAFCLYCNRAECNGGCAEFKAFMKTISKRGRPKGKKNPAKD